MTVLDTQIRRPLTGSTGGKGGGKSHTPVEHPNDLQSRSTARILDLVSEGEIEGLFDSVDPLKSVYFDDVPIMNSDGSLNYEGVQLVERVGTPTQTPIPGFSAVEAEVTVNEEVTKVSPVIENISNTSVDAIRIKIRIPALYKQQSNGDLTGTAVNFLIEVQPNGGSYSTVVDETIDGKTSGPYKQQHRIELSSYAYPINVRITRVTSDSGEATLQNQIFWDSYTEIQEINLFYPDSAYYSLTLNAELFSGGIPRRSFDIKGIKIQHPSNYDPDTRVYTGIWDGTFLTSYCNNPAWVFYDLLVNKRYGLGERLAPSQVDKFALYTIGQYCDELVDDGFGGTEPRFETNGVIATQREAYTVVNAFASMFRGLTYWSAGGVAVSQDAPADPTRLITEAGVVGGAFTYSGTGLKARKSAAAVTWNDPVDNYNKAIEVIEDPQQINIYGLRTAKIQAFMCTSQGLANRLGKWVLDSQKHETQTVTFTTGFDFADARPGEIIQIADRAMQNARLGGRVVSFNYSDVRPDAVPDETFAKETEFSSDATWTPSTNSIDRNNHAVFHSRIKVPSNIVPVGCLMEAGRSATSGMYIGFDGNGDLIYRAGDGSASPDVNDSARIVVLYADIPKDREIDIVWDVKVNNINRAGRIRLWINNQFVAEKATADGTDFTGNEFADSDNGAYGKVSSSGTVAGEAGDYTDDLEDCGITIESVLTYWRNGLVTTFLSGETETDGFVEDESITTVTTYAGVDSGEFERDADAILTCSVTTPAVLTPEGCIFEFGNGNLATEESVFLGFDSNGDLVFHAGKAGPEPITDTDHARIRIPASEFLPATQYNFIVDIQPASGLIRLWINFVLRGTAQTSDLSAFQNGQSADAGVGSYGQVIGSTIVGASFALDFNGTLDSELTYFNDSIVGDVSGSYNVGTITLDAPYASQEDDRLLLITEDGHMDSLEIRGGTTGTTVELLTSPTRAANADYDTMFLIQGAVKPTEWRILSFRESDGNQFEITAIQHDKNKYSRIENDLVIDVAPTSFFPTGPLVAPTDLTIIENLYLSNGTVKTRIDISWLASTDPRVALYRVEVKPPDGNNFYMLSVDSVAMAQILDAQDGVWSFRIRAIMGSNKPSSSPPLEALDYTIFGKSLPPADVTNFVAVRGYDSVYLSWAKVTDLDLAGYTVKQGASYDAGTTITDTFIGTTLEVPLESVADVSFHIKAVDTVVPPNFSVGATRVDTTAKAVPAITNFHAYQIGRDAFLRWDHLSTVASVKYEVRIGPTSATWEQAELFAIVESPELRKKKSVNAATTFRFRIKPFVEFVTGIRQYGPETTVDKLIYPVLGNSPTKSQTEETAWTGRTGILPIPAADESIADGGAINSAFSYTSSGSPPNMGRSQSAVMRITIKVPTAVTPLGTIWELGNTNDGGLVCFDGNQDLVVRAGDGSGSWNVNHIARIVIPNASIPSNVDFDLMWDIRCDGVNSGRVRVWIDGFLVGEDETDDASRFQSDIWSATNDGQVDGNNGSTPTGEAGSFGQDVTDSGVLLQTSMDYWADILVADGMEITGSDEMALKADETYGEYIYDFDHATPIFGNLWYEETSLFLTSDPLEIFEATGDIFDADYPITEEINGAGIPQIQFFIQLDGTGDFIPFEEADFSFTTSKIKIEFRRNANDGFRPALSNLATYQNVPSFML